MSDHSLLVILFNEHCTAPVAAPAIAPIAIPANIPGGKKKPATPPPKAVATPVLNALLAILHYMPMFYSHFFLDATRRKNRITTPSNIHSSTVNSICVASNLMSSLPYFALSSRARGTPPKAPSTAPSCASSNTCASLLSLSCPKHYRLQ